ncbi:hypothetical protein K438DRAFT_1865827, partial [Mycena galopus ATCC 62051]
AASYSEPATHTAHNLEDSLKWGMKRIDGFLAQPEKYAVLIVASESHPVPFASAVWDIAVTTPSKEASDDGINERRDANLARLREFRCQQLYLVFIATHPDFRHRGSTSLLCRGWPVTLFASAVGKKTYDSLGFDTLGTETVQVEGEEDKFYAMCMEWKASWVNVKAE